MSVFFLKVKRWQLFFLTVGIPVLLLLVLLKSANGDFFVHHIIFFSKSLALTSIIFFAWLWFVVIGLHSMISTHLKLDLKWFKIFFFLPFFFIPYILLNKPLQGVDIVNDGIGASVLFYLLIHLSTSFCLVYSLYFVAKVFTIVKLRREVSFSDFSSVFFLLLFCFYIGVWIMQPQINKMAEEGFSQ